MNPWDLFTWFCSLLLAASTLIIFGYFLSGLKEQLHLSEKEKDGD